MRLVGNKLILTMTEAQNLREGAYSQMVTQTFRSEHPHDRKMGLTEITLDLPLEEAHFPVNGLSYVVSGTQLQEHAEREHDAGRIRLRKAVGPSLTADAAPLPPPEPEVHVSEGQVQVGMVMPLPEETTFTFRAPLSFRRLQEVCKTRSARWHDTPEKQWSDLEIAGAMAGEAGEAANVAKKIKRYDCGMVQARVKKDRSALVYALAKEICDMIIYGASLANQEDIDLEAFIIQVFNDVSEENGFPERL